MPEIEIYREALRRWGPEAQMLMAFEEMSELQKELCKAARGKQNKAEIAEEIADVQIMLGQMILLHDCADEVEEQKARKLERLEGRLQNAAKRNPAMKRAVFESDYAPGTTLFIMQTDDGDIIMKTRGEGEMRITTYGGKLHGKDLVDCINGFSKAIDALRSAEEGQK